MNRALMKSLLAWRDSKHRKPLLLKGARQVGKTYLLQAFGSEHFRKCHYINFESDKLEHLFEAGYDPKRILRDLSFFLDDSIDLDEDCLIFDEIQACEPAITSLKYFAEQMPQLALCAAGSLLGVKLSKASFPVGKVQWLNLYPMTFMEFLAAVDEPMLLDYLESLDVSNASDVAHQRCWEQFKIYLVTGGLPEVVHLYKEHKENLFQALSMARAKQKDLLSDYYADIAKHAGKVNAMHIDRLWQEVANQLAASHDAQSSKFRFKDIVPGIDRYSRLASVIDWLENAGLILKCPVVNQGQMPLSAYTKESQFKLYLFDVGMLGAMLNLPPKILLNYDYGTYKGYYAENFIACAMSSSSLDNLYNWQEGRSEVEFLMETDEGVIPVEVKAGNITKAKSLAKFSDKYHPPYKVIYSGKNVYIDETTKTRFYPLYLAGD